MVIYLAVQEIQYMQANLAVQEIQYMQAKFGLKLVVNVQQDHEN